MKPFVYLVTQQFDQWATPKFLDANLEWNSAFLQRSSKPGDVIIVNPLLGISCRYSRDPAFRGG